MAVTKIAVLGILTKAFPGLRPFIDGLDVANVVIVNDQLTFNQATGILTLPYKDLETGEVLTKVFSLAISGGGSELTPEQVQSILDNTTKNTQQDVKILALENAEAPEIPEAYNDAPVLANTQKNTEQDEKILALENAEAPEIPEAYDDSVISGRVLANTNKNTQQDVKILALENTGAPVIPEAYNDAPVTANTQKNTEQDVKILALENAEDPVIPEAYDDTDLRDRLSQEALSRRNADNSLDNEIAVNAEKNTEQDTRLQGLEHATTSGGYNDAPVTANTNKNTQQDGLILANTTKNTQQDGKILANTTKNTQQDGKILALENAEAPEIPEAYDDTAITGRVTATETKNTQQDVKILALENAEAPEIPEAYNDAPVLANTQKNTEQDTAIASNTQKNTEQDAKITGLEHATTSGGYDDAPVTANTLKNTEQDGKILTNTNKNTQQEGLISANTNKNTAQDEKILALENAEAPEIPEAYDDSVITGRVTATETKNTQQDVKILALENAEAPEDYDDTAITGRVLATETKNIQQDGKILANTNKNIQQDGKILALENAGSSVTPVTSNLTLTAGLVHSVGLYGFSVSAGTGSAFLKGGSLTPSFPSSLITFLTYSQGIEFHTKTGTETSVSIIIDGTRYDIPKTGTNQDGSINWGGFNFDIWQGGVGGFNFVNGQTYDIQLIFSGVTYMDTPVTPGTSGAYDDTAITERVLATETKNTQQDVKILALENAEAPEIPEAYDDSVISGRVLTNTTKNTQQDVKILALENAEAPEIPEAYDDAPVTGRLEILEEKTSPISSLPSTPIDTNDDVLIALAGEDDIVLINETFKTTIPGTSFGSRTGKLVAKFGLGLNPSNYVFIRVDAEGVETILAHGSDLLKKEQAEGVGEVSSVLSLTAGVVFASPAFTGFSVSGSTVDSRYLKGGFFTSSFPSSLLAFYIFSPNIWFFTRAGEETSVSMIVDGKRFDLASSLMNIKSDGRWGEVDYDRWVVSSEGFNFVDGRTYDIQLIMSGVAYEAIPTFDLIKSYGSGDTNILVNIDANVTIKVQKLDHNSKANFLLDTKPKAQVNALIQTKLDELPAPTNPTTSSSGLGLSGDDRVKLDQHQLIFVPKPTPFETRGFKQDSTDTNVVGNYTQADSFTAVADGKIQFIIDSNEARTHADFTINDGTRNVSHTAVESFTINGVTYFVYQFTGVSGETYTASFNGGSRHLKSNLDIEKNKADILSLKNEQRESTSQIAKDFHKSITESTAVVDSSTEDARVDKIKSFASLDNVTKADGTNEFQRSNIYTDKGSESDLTNAILETQVDQQGFTSVPLEINGLSSNSLAIGFLMKMRASSGQDVSLIKKSGRDILILKGDGVYARNYQLERLANTSTMEHTPLRFDNNTRYTYTAPQFDVGVTDIHVALPADLVGNPNAVISNIVLNIHRSETADGLVVNEDREALSIPLNADLSPTMAIPEFVEGNYGSESTRVLFSHKSSDNGKDIAIQVQLPFNRGSVAIDSLRITATLDYQVRRTQAVAESTIDIPLISTEDLIVDVRLTTNEKTNFACELFEDASNGLQIRTVVNNIPSYVRFANWTRIKISNTSVVIAKESRVSVSILTILSFKIGTTRVFEAESLPKKIETYGLGLLAFFKAVGKEFNTGDKVFQSRALTAHIGGEYNSIGSISNTIFNLANTTERNSTPKPVLFTGEVEQLPEGWAYDRSTGLTTLPKGVYMVFITVGGMFLTSATPSYKNEVYTQVILGDSEGHEIHTAQFIPKTIPEKQSLAGVFVSDGIIKLLISIKIQSLSFGGSVVFDKGHLHIVRIGNI